MTTTNTTTQPINFPIWKTIKLGTGLKTFEDFKKAFDEEGIYFGNFANFVRHPSFRVSDELVEVDLVKVSDEDLGYDNSRLLQGLELRKEIIKLALAQGLVTCPAEVGPQLRLQYRGGDYVLIGTEPLPCISDEGEERMAGMGISSSEDGKKLHAHCFMADWFIMNRVFIKPRKAG